MGIYGEHIKCIAVYIAKWIVEYIVVEYILVERILDYLVKQK